MSISIEGIARRFPAPGGGDTTVFEDFWLKIGRGEFVCVLGHSGCGKTTVLNILAGLDRPSAGVVIFGNQAISGPSLDRAVIFQGHALLPWRTALGNVAYAVKARHPKWSRTKIREHSQHYLALVGLEEAAERRPAQLSGGMKQRVGIARALSLEPGMLLMDEPFSALDALTRGALQDEVRRICLETEQTVFMITHDVDEAMFLADRIVLMTNGPEARIAEVVENPLPRDRRRDEIHTLAAFYPFRNHLIEFLVHRSMDERGKAISGRRLPPVVTLDHSNGQFVSKENKA